MYRHMLNMVALATFLVQGQASAAEAFGKPGTQATWSSAKKTQIGTFYGSNRSPLWFTSAEGVLTELYYPSVDKAQLRDAQFLVSDGKSLFLEERKDFKHDVEFVTPVLTKHVNRDPEGRLSISHTYYTLEDAPTLVDEVTITVNTPGLAVYLLVNPHIDNTGSSDRALVENGVLYFQEGATHLRVSSTSGFEKVSVGFEGASDGWTDLKNDFKMDHEFDSATDGNVAGLAKLMIPSQPGTYTFQVVYEFDAKYHASQTQSRIKNAKNNYNAAWQKYFATLKIPSGLSTKEELLYWRSIYAMKVMEDRAHPGALIASLSIPWGEEQKENGQHEVGGYHLIWPRDLYEVAFALLAAGDRNAPQDALRFLKRIQYTRASGDWHYGGRVIAKEGAFPQNTWVDGRNYWSGFQIDQVGYPVLLFYHLYRSADPAQKAQLMDEFGPMITSALTFIQKNGPWTAQERWEESFGISPDSFAVAASALLVGDEIFTDEIGHSYAETARGWLQKPGDNIDSWTFTTSGPFGSGHYYLRVVGCDDYLGSWDPNRDATCTIANSGQRVKAKEIVDQGFLKLVLLGLKDAKDPKIKSSLEVLNQHLRVTTPKGTAWYRYKYDAYGEEKKGRLWTLLISEHARYEIERFTAQDITWSETEANLRPMIDSYLGLANAGYMLPEQVFENGEGTGGATPLSWSHAEYVKLLWSRDLQRNIENPF